MRIQTARTVLVPVAVSDSGDLAEVLAASELYGFIGGSPPTADELAARYAKLVVGHSPDRTEDWHNWVVRRLTDERAVGTVQATLYEGGRRADLAWVVGLPWQGQGYASEAARALVDWLAAGGALHIGAHVHPDHHASAGVARNAGLTATGQLDEDGEQLWEWAAPAAPSR